MYLSNAYPSYQQADCCGGGHSPRQLLIIPCLELELWTSETKQNISPISDQEITLDELIHPNSSGEDDPKVKLSLDIGP